MNTRFVELWTELLRQVWMGIENDRNAVGANPTDPSYVAYLAQTLGEMLRMRKRNGMLVREEFAYVTMLSWFHLTVESDTTVVTDLQAIAGANGNPADRLAAIGARVGITPPRQARELFELADLMSFVLWFIELDQFSTPATAALLYQNIAAQPGGAGHEPRHRPVAVGHRRARQGAGRQPGRIETGDAGGVSLSRCGCRYRARAGSAGRPRVPDAAAPGRARTEQRPRSRPART